MRLIGAADRRCRATTATDSCVLAFVQALLLNWCAGRAIATAERTSRDVSNVPTRDSCTAALPGLFYHLVGPSKQRGRDRELQRLGGLEVDKHLVSVRLLHGEVRRFGSPNDFVDVSGALPAHCDEIRP